ncbi:hypothetical protein AK812_SmicGene44571 [Symbiodinium microadriaticum]|uniref:Uncharacterized protein n=1 Tax=Symbiodinium microadriaticum TaxID=2951 RepID=A0A1Q9BY51_SYMMI|nr:hypothetical protein AK812_SmicGene44571 [Symbiodinium microadriaticum]CAE7304069.1 unnamed protein product [Symbiodinium microadriaticum]
MMPHVVPPKTPGSPKTVNVRPGFAPQPDLWNHMGMDGMALRKEYVRSLKAKDVQIARLRQELLQKELTIKGLLKDQKKEPKQALAKGAPAAGGKAAAVVVPARVKEVLVKKEDSSEGLRDPTPGRASGAGSGKAGPGKQ